MRDSFLFALFVNVNYGSRSKGVTILQYRALFKKGNFRNFSLEMHNFYKVESKIEKKWKQ